MRTNRSREISPERLAECRRMLLDRQRHLFREVEDVEADLRFIEEDRESEFEERAQEVAAARLLARLDDQECHELEEIHRALARIASGDYGACEGCRRPITLRRLRAVPAARLCRACQDAAETVTASPPPEAGGPPGSGAPLPPELRDLSDEDIAEVVRERLRTEGAREYRRVRVRCRDAVVYLYGEIPSEPQRQVVVQIVTDALGLETADHLRVAAVYWEQETARGMPPPEDPRFTRALGTERLTEDIVEAEEEGLPYSPPAGPVPDEE